jgi:hypothetical protein
MLQRLSFSFLFLLSVLLLNSCTSTFAGTLLVVTFKDIIYYIIFAFIFALLIGLKSENEKKSFWLWFVLNLLLTPLCGFIYLLIKISKRL